MAKCACCATTILFGGKSHGGLRFCSDTCALQLQRARTAEAIPLAHAQALAAKLHAGSCSVCAGPGPVDMRASHLVWSAVVVTTWRSETLAACRACGLKRQARAALSCFALGWWAVPWGLLMTPVQLLSNAGAMLRPPDPSRPSEPLVQHARLLLGDAMLERQAAASVDAEQPLRASA